MRMKPMHQGVAGLSAALAVSLTFAAGSATAATSTGTLGATTSVVAANSATVATSPVSFPSYNPVATAPTDGAGQVTVTATGGLSYSIGLGGGLAPSSGTRQLQGPSGGLLGYNLFTSSARSTVWGEGQSGFVGQTVPGTGSGAAQPYPVYGRIFPGQGVPAGAYSDSVLVTVTF